MKGRRLPALPREVRRSPRARARGSIERTGIIARTAANITNVGPNLTYPRESKGNAHNGSDNR